MGTMGKIAVVVLLGVVAVCLGDKDPTLSLRPPSSSSPVFSSSIDSIPVHSASTHQHNVYAKRPNSLHSSASASAGGSASASSSDQVSSGGRNNNAWNTPANTFGFDFNGGGGGDVSGASGSSHSASSSSSGGYYEHPPAQTVSSSSPSDSYSPTSGSGTQGPAYAYYYQHYPNSAGSGHGWSGGEDGGGILGDLSLPGFQLPGLGGAGGGLTGIGGGVGVVKVLKVLAKGVLVLKPFLILGLLLLIAVPVLFLLLPIPIITITGQPSLLRSARSSPYVSYLTQLSGKVLNAEECLERIICKMPHVPEKYQTRAKLFWDEYGSKVVSNERVSRGLNAYFESSSQKNKNLKCDQRFKCSNKYL